jgi:predicted methyltransferase MtxX (methanogen marker protein 4)
MGLTEDSPAETEEVSEETEEVSEETEEVSEETEEVLTEDFPAAEEDSAIMGSTEDSPVETEEDSTIASMGDFPAVEETLAVAFLAVDASLTGDPAVDAFPPVSTQNGQKVKEKIKIATTDSLAFQSVGPGASVHEYVVVQKFKKKI